MAASTGIILAAGGITMLNEWLHHKFNWKVPAATFGAAVVFAGLEKLSPAAAVGVASIALITVLVGGVTPGVPSPVAQIISVMNGPGKAPAKGRAA